MNYSPKHAKQFYLQGFTERHRKVGKAAKKYGELNLCSLAFPFAVWLHFFSTAKLCHELSGHISIKINCAHHGNSIYSLYCTKKAYGLKTNQCLWFVCMHLLSEQITVNNVYTVIYLIIDTDFQNLKGHQKFAGSE